MTLLTDAKPGHSTPGRDREGGVRLWGKDVRRAGRSRR